MQNPLSRPQPRIAKRHYSQFKKNILHDAPNLTRSGDTFYKTIFEYARTVKLIFDPLTLKIVEANPAACKFYGYTLEQLKTMRMTDISSLPEPDVETIKQRVISGTETIFQTRHRLASGAICDVEVFAGLLQVGAKSYIYGDIHDITDRLRIEEALYKSESLYRLLVQNMPNTTVIMFDRDMRYTLAEGPYIKRAGSQYENLVGKFPQDILSENSLTSLLPIYKRALQGESFDYERSGDNFAYKAYVTPVRNPDGQIIGGMILTHDILAIKRAEEAILESEQRYQAVINTISQGIIVQNQDGIIQTCNSAAEQILGLTADQMMGRTSIDPLWRAVHEDGSPFPGETHPIMITLHTGQPISNVIMGVHKPDDSLAWISINSRPIVRPNETQAYAAVATFVDITERKQARDDLRASEERLRLITDNVQDLITLADAENRIIFASPSSQSILGYQPQALLGKRRQELFAPEDHSNMLARRQQLIATKQSEIILEGRLVHADGHEIDIETVGKLLFDDQSNYVGSVYITRDITERKRMEETLRASETKLRLITDNIHDLVTQNDLKGRFTFVSASSRTILGYEPDDLLGRPSFELIHPDDLTAQIQIFQLALDTHTPQFRFEGRMRHADGHYIPVETVGQFVFDDQSNITSGVFISRDITERQHFQSALIEQEKVQTALEKEHELNLLKTHMMQRITHEFRTPLTVIQALMETLTYYYDRLTPDQKTEKTARVKNHIQHITDMLDEIGLVVKSDFEPDHFHPVSTDLSALCREVAASLEAYFSLPHKFALDLPETTILLVDPTVLKTALMHIMRNAARFSDSSSPVTLHLSRLQNAVLLRVTDTGIGILPNELARIFDPFFRGSNINERSGLGIGLTLARAAIAAHNGTITVQSVPLQGATFTITLPVS